MDFISLFENPGFGLDLSSNGPDEPADGPEGFQIESRGFDFFMFSSI
jgi:hypothetical protein